MLHLSRGIKGAKQAAHTAQAVWTLASRNKKKTWAPSSDLLWLSLPRAQDSTQEKVHQYVRDNTARAWKAVEAIEQGDAQGLGRVMAAAQVWARVWERTAGGGRGGGETSHRGAGGRCAFWGLRRLLLSIALRTRSGPFLRRFVLDIFFRGGVFLLWAF